MFIHIRCDMFFNAIREWLFSFNLESNHHCWSFYKILFHFYTLGKFLILHFQLCLLSRLPNSSLLDILSPIFQFFLSVLPFWCLCCLFDQNNLLHKCFDNDRTKTLLWSFLTVIEWWVLTAVKNFLSEGKFKVVNKKRFSNIFKEKKSKRYTL